MSDDTTEQKSFDLTVVSSTNEWWGGGLILIGILIWLAVNVWVRPWLTRDEGLIPAAQLLVVLETIDEQLAKAEKDPGWPSSGQLRGLLDKVRQRIISEVEKTRPTAVATTFVDEVALATNILSELVGRGIAVAMSRLDASDPNNVKAVRDALADLDLRARKAHTVLEAEAIVDDVLNTLKAALPAPPQRALVQGGVAPAAPAVPAAVRVKRLEKKSAAMAVWLWVLWAVITWVTGLAALILSNDAFGTGLNLVTCFLWGLGIQAVGQSLQQMTPTTIATSLRVSAP